MNPLIPPNLVWPDEVTPPLQHQATAEFVRQLKHDAVAVLVTRARKRLPIGNCYWNVAAKIDDKGGAMALGWQIVWWRQRYLRAMHHAVWRGPEGKLVDVTEASPTDQRSQVTVFVPDDRIQISQDRPAVVPNQFSAIGHGPVTQALIEAQVELDAARVRLAALAYQAGDRCEDQKLAARTGKLKGTINTPALTEEVWRSIDLANAEAKKALEKCGEAIRRARG